MVYLSALRIILSAIVRQPRHSRVTHESLRSVVNVNLVEVAVCGNAVEVFLARNAEGQIEVCGFADCGAREFVEFHLSEFQSRHVAVVVYAVHVARFHILCRLYRSKRCAELSARIDAVARCVVELQVVGVDHAVAGARIVT